jgi:uncharacterized sporulation protein YeaH/YhbH (DUF444 family)
MKLARTNRVGEQIIDRRLNGKNKSAVNRQKFIQRFKGQIKKAVTEAMSGRSITDLNRGEKINIPAKDISEPVFGHGSGGKREGIHPGNTDFVSGDRVARPPGGGGSGGKASKSGEGDDDFSFELSRDEFLDIFFEDLELPDLIKTQLAKQVQYKTIRAGYTATGTPSNLNVIRSMKSSLGRRIATRTPYARKLREAEEELAAVLLLESPESPAMPSPRVMALQEEIRKLKSRIRTIPFIDTFDLKYNNRIKQPKPTTQAVMFCLMDVSGSMDEGKKDMAKRFFTLLYLFLTRSYEKIDLVFIRHHTVAKEVDEEEFFYSRETGGTVVSSALQMMYEIIKERYPSSDWNIYGAQASDGDNWTDDSPICRDVLINAIMPHAQYYAYVEITEEGHQGLWREYLAVKRACANFAMQHITSPADIYPVFRKLFQKKLA